MNEIVHHIRQPENRMPNLLEAILMHGKAMVEGIAVSAEIKHWSHQRRLTEARGASLLSDHEARTRLATASSHAEEAEAEARFLTMVCRLDHPEAQRIVGADAETQRLLLERDRLRKERVTLLQPQPHSAGWPIEPSISDREIETLALRAVRRAAAMEPRTVDAFWQQWREQARLRLPAYAAAEAISRAGELWEQTR